MRRSVFVGVWLGSLLAAAAATSVSASEIPAFARRYRVSCNLCHTAVPKLSAFGQQFAGNGFRMASEEPPRDTIDTGDDLLNLYRDLPLAIRLDAYANAYTNGGAKTDWQTPLNLKIMSGGPISNKISYYFYFLLFERGEIGGVEDAFVYFNDIANVPIDAAVGQFQVSDPMFKRELRLEYQDYAMYRARIGDLPTDLTYDRGAIAAADFAGFTLTGAVLNGNGKGPADETLHFDNDFLKNAFGHLTRDVLPFLRLGAMGYYAPQRATVEDGSEVQNQTWMLGGDATVTLGPVEINAQYIHREDDTPTFTLGEPEAITNGGFGEIIVQPAGARWYVLGLYNLIHTNRPLLDVRLGGPAGLTRYQAATAGVGYLLRRNFRIMAEGTWDVELKESRWTIGLTTAF
jgi:thiol-disulfide isomerase/thioredoxin